MVNKDIIINDILIPSLRRLYEVDYLNIKYGVSERNICARLAHHMENIMREYETMHGYFFFRNCYADVEYNRMGDGSLKHYEDSEKRPRYMVVDLLIQERGYRNLLAVEMKRKGNYAGEKKDKERLKKMVSLSPPESNHCVFGTLVGAFIRYSENWVKIFQFEDFHGQGKQSQEMIIINYDKGLNQLEHNCIYKPCS
ncbi:MAG: hypothetical protein J6U21_09670 [Bacteroidales bacterium]|nr:hypothetical protein [Bacteroidales bacterium]